MMASCIDLFFEAKSDRETVIQLIEDYFPDFLVSDPFDCESTSFGLTVDSRSSWNFHKEHGYDTDPPLWSHDEEAAFDLFTEHLKRVLPEACPW
jgi:hypothetical protein